jgi:hypothetical protein
VERGVMAEIEAKVWLMVAVVVVEEEISFQGSD